MKVRWMPISRRRVFQAKKIESAKKHVTGAEGVRGAVSEVIGEVGAIFCNDAGFSPSEEHHGHKKDGAE